MMSAHLASITLSYCLLNSKSNFTFSFFITASGLCSYHYSTLSSLYLLHSTLCMICAILSYHFMYFYCTNMLHSLPMWLTVSPGFSIHYALCRICRLVNVIFDIVGSEDFLLCSEYQRFCSFFQVAFIRPCIHFIKIILIIIVIFIILILAHNLYSGLQIPYNKDRQSQVCVV